MLLELVKTTILMVLKAGTDDPRLSYAGAIMGRGRGSPPYPVKGAIPFPGTLYGAFGKRLSHRAFNPGSVGSIPPCVTICRVGGTGRHSGFKIRRLWRMGSNPIPGTNIGV